MIGTKKQLVISVIVTALVLSIVALTGCFSSQNVQKSELDRFVGTWDEIIYDPSGGTSVKGNVTFNNDGTGVSYLSDVFPEKFNYSISAGKIYLKYGVPEESATYDYYFSEDYETLNVRNTFGGTVTVYTKQ